MITTTIDAATYRDMHHTPEVATDHPDKWLDWGDHTTQVDPVAHHVWAGTALHSAHTAHQHGLNRKDVSELVRWEASNTPPAVEFFTPATSTIDGMAKFQVAPDKERWRGLPHDTSREGELPAISKLFYSNDLKNDVSQGDIEAAIRESARRAGARVFDKSDPAQPLSMPAFDTSVTRSDRVDRGGAAWRLDAEARRGRNLVRVT